MLTTGSDDLDDLLGGGIKSNAIIEFHGEFRTGKTQIAHQLCVNVQLPYDKGGLEGNAVYIDTKGDYSEDRIIQMAVALDLNYDTVLERIKNGYAYNSSHQIGMVNELHEFIAKENIKLIIIDSIIHHFRDEYIKKDNTADCKSRLYKHLHDLHELCAIYPDLRIVITNQVDEKNNFFFGNPITHLGGHEIAHGSHIIIYLRKLKGEQRVARVMKAPNLPEADAYFTITDDGIRDV